MAKSFKANCERLMPAVSLLVALAALTGCGPAGLDLVRAGGSVTLDGKPVADAAVVFVSAEGGHLAHGVTDEHGRFNLATTNRPGAVAGEHQVAVTKQNVFDPTLDGGIGKLKIEWLVPQRYGKPDTSGLTATVPAGGIHDLNFDLASR